MHPVPLALPQEPAGGFAGWAADLIDTLGAPGAGLAIALENLFPPAGLLAVGVARSTLGWGELLTQAVLGPVLLFLDVQGLFSLAALDARLAGECYGPGERESLRRRIGEPAASRAAVVRAVDRQRRRVERDLHDGVPRSWSSAARTEIRCRG